MSDTARLTVNIEVRGDDENTPSEALHHALAGLHAKGLIISWSEPQAYSDLCSICGAASSRHCELEDEAGGVCPRNEMEA